jgi:2-amino-4-hydroxy-6-hydroxymethyldihydropteridine diphosphokinase
MSRDLARPLPTPERASRETVSVVIALGSNLGDREGTLEAAAAEIGRLPLVDDIRLSPVMRSVALTPSGPDPSKPEYLNAVAIIRTRLAPTVLLGYLQRIESEHGRVRLERWGDRTLDLDMISYGDLHSTDPHLTLPHPRARERVFVLRPWSELDPDAVLPGHGRVADLLAGLRA